MNTQIKLLVATSLAVGSLNLVDAQPTEFVRVATSSITVGGEVFKIREEQGGGGDDSVWRFEDTIWQDGRELAMFSGWRTATPLKDEWTICLVAVADPAPCVHLTQTYPDISGNSVTLASHQVERSTFGELKISYTSETLYSGPFNGHYEDLETIRSLPLAVPADLAKSIVSGAQEAQLVHAVLAAASAAADEVIRTRTYEVTPLVTAADPVGIAIVVIESALPDLVAQRAMSPAEFTIERDDPLTESAPDGYLDLDRLGVAGAEAGVTRTR